MNQDREEQKLRQLFREARQADELCAPSFAETIAARPARWPAVTWPGNWRIAVATLALLAIGIGVLVFFYRSAVQPTEEAIYTPQPPALSPYQLEPMQPPSVLPPPLPIKQPQAIKGRMVRMSVSRRGPRSLERRPEVDTSALLSFKWQSPTAFLLRTPGADLLKAMPRIGDSRVKFEVIDFDEKN